MNHKHYRRMLADSFSEEPASIVTAQKSTVLEHYSPKSGLKSIDPSKMGSEVDSVGRARNRMTQNKFSFYYPENYEKPEPFVKDRASSKYKVELSSEHNIFDTRVHGNDITQKVRERNNGRLDMDDFISELKQAGFHGFKSRPDGLEMVAMFHELPVKEEIPLKSFKFQKSEDDMQKMSRPRITLPNLQGMPTRPDQEVQLLTNEKQKKLYGRKVANAEFKNREVTRPTRLSGSRSVIRNKPELLDAYGKRVSGKFDRRTLGTVYDTEQGPKAAAIAGKLRSKYEAPDDAHDAKLSEYKQKYTEARQDYENKIRQWRDKAENMPMSWVGSDEWREHDKNRPKFKAPRRPSKKLKETTELSPQEMALRGKSTDSTIEHEGTHHVLASVEQKYGPVARSRVVNDLLSHHHPEAVEAIERFITDTRGYKRRSPNFREEILTHARDLLVNPKKRDDFKKYLANSMGGRTVMMENKDREDVFKQLIGHMKRGHQKAYERGKQIQLKDIRPDLAEQNDLKTSEKIEKGTKRDMSDSLKFIQFHAAPDFTPDESPAGYRKANKTILNSFHKFPKKSVSLNVDVAHERLMPVDNGRVPTEKQMKNPIILGKFKSGDHVILDGNHRLLQAKKMGIKNIKATVLHLPDEFQSLLALEGGVGRLKKYQELFTAEKIEKGAARRLYGKLDPAKLPDREKVKEWQTSTGFLQDLDSSYDDETHQQAREELPAMDPGTRLRALNKLSSKTLTRKHPETGERQFLLFRGIGEHESHTVSDKHIHNTDSHSSWTPHISIARMFEGDHDVDDSGNSRTIAAWVNEGDIHHSPTMYGNLPDLKIDMDNAGQFYVPDKRLRGQNEFQSEHEVVVKPHKSMRATKGDVKRYEAIHIQNRSKITGSDPKKDLNARINYRGAKELSGHGSTPNYPLMRETKPLSRNNLEQNKDKLAASEEREQNLKKNFKGIRAGILGAIAAGAMSAPSQSVAEQRRVSPPKLTQQKQDNSNQILNAIADVESSGGKNIKHRMVSSGVNAGTYSRSKYGLMPLTIKETIKMHPDLKQKYGHLLSMKGDAFHKQYHSHEGLDKELASRHLQRLKSHFGDDVDKISMAWLNGITGTKRAIKQGQDISNHWHVKKVRDAFANQKMNKK